MLGEQLTRGFDRFHQRVRELFPPKVLAHALYQPLPEFRAALPVHPFVPDDGEFLRARQHENQDAISFPGRVHPELVKFLLGSD